MGHNHPVIDADPHFKIDKTTRAITDASGKQSVLMQGDHNSERYTFEIPRYIDGHDMSLCDLVEIHYVNTDSNKRTENKGIYIVDDLQVSETQPDEVVQFTWLISNAVTVNAGPLSFLIRFSCTEGGKTIYAWNTGINKDKSISLSMYNADTIQQEQPDLIAHIEEAIKGKLDSKNRTPDKFLGTDGTGKVIDKDISYSDVKNTPSKLPNPQKLTISGYATGTYDGSSAVTIQIPTPDIPSKVSQLQNDSNFANQTEVGNKVNEHNVNNQSHNDIRLSIKGLTDRLNTLMDSEDVSLDQLSEIVTYIKNNKSLIDGITTNKLNVTDVVNNFTTNVTTKALSASMGVELKRLIDAIKIPDVAGQINAHNTSGTSHKDIRDEVAKKAGKSTTLSGYGITDGATKSELSGHNTNSSAHNDIRELVAKLTERLNTVANSSDVSLDQLSEIVAYIKNNKSLIEQVTTNKLNVTDVVNNLTTNVGSKALSASMGVELKRLIDSIKTTDASAQISEHDKSKTAHADIRTDVTTLKEALIELDNTKADAIVSSASGEQIVLTDSDNESFKGLHVYGKSTQVTTKGYQLLKDTWAEIFKQPMESIAVDGKGYFKFIRDYKINAEFSPLFSDISKIIPQMNDDDVVYFRFNKIASKETYNYQATFKTSDNKDVCETTRNGSIVSTTYGVLKNSRKIRFYFYSNTSSATARPGDTFQFIISKNPKCEYEPYTGGKPSPSIEYPQEIVSAGDKGNINVDVYGGNLLKIPDFENADVKITNEKDVIIVEKKTNTEGDIYRGKGFELDLIAGKYVLDFDGFTEHSFTKEGHRVQIQLDGKPIASASYPSGSTKSFTLKKNSTIRVVIFTGYAEANKKYKIKGLRINREKSIPFEPYKEPQTLTLSTPNGLLGIPVSTGGNYTDSKGQQWVTDEVDLERGKYIQRVEKVNFDGSADERWEMNLQVKLVYANIGLELNSKRQYDMNILCNSSKPSAWNSKVICFINEYKQFSFYCNDIPASVFENDDNFKAWLANHPLEIVYEIKTPIERDLTPEEITAYKSLHTNYPTTVITNDENAGMEVSYVADTKNYIDKKFAELNQVIVNTQISLL